MKRVTDPNRQMNGIGAAAIISLVAIFSVGCASIPAPTEQIAVSKAEVTSAIRDGGNEFAPLELKSATDKMEAAERAMTESNYTLARRLAEQAQVDAKLAATKAAVAKTQKSVDHSQESNRVLRDEIKRTAE